MTLGFLYGELQFLGTFVKNGHETFDHNQDDKLGLT